MNFHLGEDCLFIPQCLYHIRLLRIPPKALDYPVPDYCFSFISYHSLHIQSFAAHALNHTTTFPFGFKMVLKMTCLLEK